MDPDNDGMKETFYMPGDDHDELNDSLEERGLPPKPGIKAMGSETDGGGMFSSSMDMDMDSGDPGKMTSDAMGEMFPGSENKMSKRDDSMAGDRPDGASMFSIYGDSDDDDQMEIY
jgi:hypothetical protein